MFCYRCAKVLVSSIIHVKLKLCSTDFDFQLSMVEFLFRMTANDDVKRQTIATTCFQDKNIRKIFTAVSDTEFEAVSTG